MTRRREMAEDDRTLAREARMPKRIRTLYPWNYEDEPEEVERVLHIYRKRRYGRKECEE